MKKFFSYPLILLILVFLQSCATPQFFYDKSSYERQQELRNCRSENVFCDIMTGIGAVCFGAMLDADIELYPSEQHFKKLKLVNPTNDTMYVNMLTDVVWDTEDYCDFMDIRIPPKLNCKVMVPMDANYNLYFSNTPQSEDDEKIEVFTSDVKKIALYPGLSAITDTVKYFEGD
jgi:hypothetical protein